MKDFQNKWHLPYLKGRAIALPVVLYIVFIFPFVCLLGLNMYILESVFTVEGPHHLVA